MEKAGLSASLMYGGSGAGGGTTGSGGGGMPTGDTGSAQMMARMQAQAMNADTVLKMATADKTKAETDKLKGADTDLINKQIESLTQGITNQKAQARLTSVQEDLAEFELATKQATFNDTVNQAHFIAQQAYQAMKIAGYEEQISKATVQQKIELVNTALTQGILQNASIKAGTEKTKAEINKMAEDVAQAWKALELKGQEVDVKQFSEEIKANYPSIINVLGKEVDDGISNLYNLFKKGRQFMKGVK